MSNGHLSAVQPAVLPVLPPPRHPPPRRPSPHHTPGRTPSRHRTAPPSPPHASHATAVPPHASRRAARSLAARYARYRRPHPHATPHVRRTHHLPHPPQASGHARPVAPSESPYPPSPPPHTPLPPPHTPPPPPHGLSPVVAPCCSLPREKLYS
ncbi:hypothetical protein NCC49_000576 [Naganishia albida]|nr:hypothetical protein NCC49_000576 [Naganishia albida]